jgi:hypothetical protein
MASRSLFLLGVHVQTSVSWFFFCSCVMLSDGCSAPLCATPGNRFPVSVWCCHPCVVFAAEIFLLPPGSVVLQGHRSVFMVHFFCVGFSYSMSSVVDLFFLSALTSSRLPRSDLRKRFRFGVISARSARVLDQVPCCLVFC